MALPILTASNQKIQKGAKQGYLTAGIHFAPASQSGRNVCPGSSAGCRLACLASSGHGRFQRTTDARIKKTQWFFERREEFMEQLIKDIQAIERKAKREGLVPALRLNLTSDIQWAAIKYQGKNIFEHFPHIQFYDYVKVARRMFEPRPVNYHLTFSRSEENEAIARTVAAAGDNVAVVFEGKLPETFWGRPVVSGDENDLRFLDGKGVIVGLTTKGRAKHDTSGFVVVAA